MPVDFRLELRKRLKAAWIERNDELARIGDLVGLGIEVDTVFAEQCTVKRSGEKTERKRKARALVAGHWQQQRLGALVRIDNSRAALWTWLRAEFARETPTSKSDDVRLREVRRVRKESFVTHGSDTHRGQLVPGRSWAAWSRALGLLLPPVDVVDLGCGDGYLAIEAARWARRVVAIDRSSDVLERAKALAVRRRVRNVTWKRGELERLPLEAETADVALLSQALHHVADPARALGEARRVLRPGGRLLVLDLREHGEAWVSRTLGDRWFGFSEARLKDLIEDAGFAETTVRVGARTPGDPFVVLIAGGTKPPVPRAPAAVPRARVSGRKIRS